MDDFSMDGLVPERPVKRVPRTIAFLDLCGFTAYTERHGDEAAYDVVTGFRAAVRRVAAERGIRIAKWLGDGVMLVGVEAEELVEAVVDVELIVDLAGSELPIRAGIARGDVMVIDGDDIIGRPAILAARLCDLAAEHQVLAEEGTIEPIMANVGLEPLGEVAVRSFVAPVRVVRLVAPGGHGRRSGGF